MNVDYNDRTLHLVEEFHRAFEVDVPETQTLADYHPETIALLAEFANSLEALGKLMMEAAAHRNGSVPLLRMQLLTEELGELCRAMANQDKTQVLDALADIRYVADGAVLSFGLGSVFTAAMHEVQRSNMSKLVDGKPVKNEAGRVQKGPNYTPPNLSQFIKE